MKKYIFTILSVLTLLSTYSCKEEDLLVFGEDKYLYFEKFWKDAVAPGTEKADSTSVTFFFAKPQDDKVYAELIVLLAGRPLEKDLKFKLKVVDNLTTALPSEYTIADSYTFRAKPVGAREKMIQDTIKIQINRSERLNTLEKGYKLALAIQEEGEVKVGQTERSIAILHITKDPVRPLWWDREIEEGLLGRYSTKKYRLFLENIPGADQINTNFIKDNPDKVRKMALAFKEWLVKNPQTEEDGSPMTVKV
ncbi:DUF4843 domain-containing protein [Porphyromonas sp.]|uniref:DUF4843 domain-containing protein n=1 Tax=Porphyromonas sp. TaxID=1924944 RepID=UPI0026DD82F3|nr:DUF4843 domain-containing protein [Porphyromonas sp.]MDO4770413.1 DUF4843 domain-containing protein [Porphyromonas sp.]